MSQKNTTKSVVLKKVRGTMMWEVAEPFLYAVDDVIYTIPKGFKTDLGSVPRIFWSFFPPAGYYTEAYVIHDHLCTTKILPSKKVHKIFRRELKKLDASWFGRWFQYLAVRWFGPKWN